MIAKPSINIEMRNDPTVVRKTTMTVKSERLILQLENVRVRMTRG